MIPPHETQAEVRPAATNTKRGLEKIVLRLVKDKSDRSAIKAGQIDAVVDPANGNVFLLPHAQQSLIQSKSILHRLCALACDWTWEQDDQCRFISREGTNVENSWLQNVDIIGKTLWELSIDDMSACDWAQRSQQQNSHATFRNFEVKCGDRAGAEQYISFSGEPIFDDLEQFKGYRGIARDITVRRQREAMVPVPNQYSSVALNALTAHVSALDSTGVVLLANNAWQAFASTCPGIGAGITEGDNYLASCDNVDDHERVDGTLIAAGIRQVVSGVRDFFRYEYACDSPAGKRWFMLNTTGVTAGGATHAVVLREDITERKRAEVLLELQYMIALCLADAEDTTETLKAVIRAICKSQGWGSGRYFQLDPVLGVLCFVESWGEPVVAEDRFLEKSRDLKFYPGAGLAGRVFQSGQPLWVCDGSSNIDLSARALAPETGREGAFVFPVTSKDKTIGVLAFTSGTVCEPDDSMLQTIKSIGSQLGRYLQRQQALDALRRSEARFRKLTELSADWYWEQNSDLRFTQYAGHDVSGTGEVLGKTFWELPNIVLSDTALAEHTSQINARWSFFDFEFAVVQADGELNYYSICGEPVYDDAGKFSGYCGTGTNITNSRTGADNMAIELPG
jgi:PAS domain-containing protein